MDGAIPDDEVLRLIDHSYELVARSPKKGALDEITAELYRIGPGPRAATPWGRRGRLLCSGRNASRAASYRVTSPWKPGGHGEGAPDRPGDRVGPRACGMRNHLDPNVSFFTPTAWSSRPLDASGGPSIPEGPRHRGRPHGGAAGPRTPLTCTFETMTELIERCDGEGTSIWNWRRGVRRPGIWDHLRCVRDAMKKAIDRAGGRGRASRGPELPRKASSYHARSRQMKGYLEKRG